MERKRPTVQEEKAIWFKGQARPIIGVVVAAHIFMLRVHILYAILCFTVFIKNLKTKRKSRTMCRQPASRARIKWILYAKCSIKQIYRNDRRRHFLRRCYTYALCGSICRSYSRTAKHKSLFISIICCCWFYLSRSIPLLLLGAKPII